MTTAPVLDEEGLARLGDQLADAELLCGFIRTYAEMLDGRVDRLDLAFAAQDADDCMDAILSLKTSSAMAGAAALSETAAGLQDYLDLHVPTACQWPADEDVVKIMCRLRDLVEETRQEIGYFLDRVDV